MAFVVLFLGLFLGLTTVGFAAQSGEQGVARRRSMPVVHGTSLAGQPVELPRMLEGKVGVLVIGFSRESRQPVAEWGRRLAAEYKGTPGVVYYEMPMLAEVPRWLRGVVVRSMRKEVPEGAQARLVPLTEDEAGWKDVVGYKKAEDAYVLVVDGTGAVRWKGHGTATDASFAAMQAGVRAFAASNGAGSGGTASGDWTRDPRSWIGSGGAAF
jgi:hypothetical protein